jgi:hypothetical protein
MGTITRIPRIEDLPYNSSKPIEFIYQSQVSLYGGQYKWADQPSPLAALRPLQVNTLYYFRTLTLSADIGEEDFTSCTTVMPNFQMFLTSQANSILFREPIYMGNFLQNFDYRFTFLTPQENDQLTGAFNGTLTQNANLIGVLYITLTAVISAQEITDDSFISLFTSKYPANRKNDYIDIMEGRK